MFFDYYNMTGKRFIRYIYAAMIGGIIVAPIFFFDIYRVASGSMEPAIMKESYIFVSRYHYYLFEPKRNDIAAFSPIGGYFEKGPWTHRIIGIPGDVITLEDGSLYVNGKQALFPEADSLRAPTVLAHGESIVLSENEVFQKGDNASWLFGIIDKSDIVGKVMFIF